MQIAGDPKRVELTVDLTRYADGLVEGSRGWTMPDTKLSIWGTQDRYVAVNFDCGAKLDIRWESLVPVEEDA